MTSNLMELYVKNTQDFIKNFTKMFFADEYDEKISKEFIDTYIDARIYSFGEEDQRFFYKRIYASLVEKKKELRKQYKVMDEKFLKNNLELYQYILYIDGVRPITDLKEFCKDMYEKRKSSFGLGPVKGLEGRMLKAIKKYNDEKESLFKENETKDFSLNIEKYTLIDDTYKVKLEYNFKIPYIYSNIVINEVFNSGVVNEDKLIIEYTLLTLVCIKDINRGNFATKYLVDFADTLYKKSTKLKQTLRVINNAAIQDKMFFKIKYKDFEENKDLIYELMQDGYRFAIIIDDTFEPNITNLKKLSVFKYLLVNPKSKNYEEIKYREDRLDNIVIYDKEV